MNSSTTDSYTSTPLSVGPLSPDSLGFSPLCESPLSHRTDSDFRARFFEDSPRSSSPRSYSLTHNELPELQFTGSNISSNDSMVLSQSEQHQPQLLSDSTVPIIQITTHTPRQPKAKHRAIDARRRDRESAAFAQLQNLLQSFREHTHLADSKSVENGKSLKHRQFKHQKPKAVVLEETVSLLTKMKSTMAGLQHSAHHTQDNSLHRSPQQQQLIHIQGLVDHNLALVERESISMSTHPLASRLFLNSGVLLSCIDLAGRCVETNKLWQNRMCWSSEQVIGHVVSPLAAYMPLLSNDPDAKTTFTLTELAPIKPSCTGKFLYLEYPASTINSLQSLLKGKSQTVQIVERLIIGCGKYVEMMTTCWLVQENSLPKYIVMCATDDGIRNKSCSGTVSTCSSSISSTSHSNTAVKLVCNCCTRGTCCVSAACVCTCINSSCSV